MLEGFENVIVSLYAKGMCNSDIEEQIREVYNFEVSTSTIFRITDSVSNDIVHGIKDLEPCLFNFLDEGCCF